MQDVQKYFKEVFFLGNSAHNACAPAAKVQALAQSYFSPPLLFVHRFVGFSQQLIQRFVLGDV